MNLTSRIEKLETAVFTDPDQPEFGFLVPQLELERPTEPEETPTGTEPLLLIANGKPSIYVNLICPECGENLNWTDFSFGNELSYCPKCHVYRPFTIQEISNNLTEEVDK